MVVETASFRARAKLRTRAVFLGFLGAPCFRIDECHYGARLNAFENGLPFRERTELDYLLLETAVALAVDDLLTFAVEDSFAGDGHSVRKVLTANDQAGSEAGTEAGIGLVQKN